MPKSSEIAREAKGEDKLDSFVRETMQRLQEVPKDYSCASHQPSFNTVITVVREVTAKALSAKIEEFQNIPFGVVDKFLNVVCNWSFVYGARIFAVLTRKTEELPAKDPVGFTEIWNALNETLQSPDTEWGKRFTSTLNQVGPIDRIIIGGMLPVMDEILKLHPVFRANEEDLAERVFGNMLRGATAEFCYVGLMGEKVEETAGVSDIAAASPVNQDSENQDNVEKLSADLDFPTEILPWPEDLQCACGKSLKPAIHCCDPNELIDMDQVKDQLGPDFLLVPPCCGDPLDGFCCDECGSIYTWVIGTVETVSG